MPRVSVILPAYNAEDTIAETVRSVLGQQFEDFELLACDDGSTDGSIRVVEKFRDPRIRICNMEHSGLSATRNRGLELAGAEFVAFIDADDLWSPDKLGSQVRRLEQSPDAAAVYSWTVFVDECGQFLFAKEPSYFHGDVFHHLLLSCFVASGSNLMARRSCLSTVGNFDPGLKTAEDWDCWLRLARRWPFALVPRFQVFYRIRSGAISGNIGQIRADQARVIRRAFRVAPDHLQHLKREAIANSHFYLSFLHLTRGMEDKGLRRAGEEICSSLRAWPAGFATRKYQKHILLWLLLHLVPKKLRGAACLRLIREYGKWQRRRLQAMDRLVKLPFQR
jgi:glycosyltransferase involved in cell wall biosynthesis